MFPEYLQYHSQMLFILFSSLRVSENVIYEYYEKRIKVCMEDPIQKVHKNTAGALVRPNDMPRNL